MTVRGWLDESFCEHQNDEQDCDEVCSDCGHVCAEHTEGECSGAVDAFYYGDAECDCEKFS